MCVGNSELTTFLYLCCLTFLWKTKRCNFILIIIIKFGNQDLMLLKTSRLTPQHRVWQNRTGWKFQFETSNPETKYQKAFAKPLCVESVPCSWRKWGRSTEEVSVWLLCVHCKTLSLHSSAPRVTTELSTHRKAGSIAAVPLLHCSGAGACLATQALLLLWGYPETQLKDPLQESRSVWSKKLLWNLSVTVLKYLPQNKQFQQTLESNIL